MITLNLLPSEDKKDLQYEKLFLIAKYSAVLLVIFMIITGGILYFAKFALKKSFLDYQESRKVVSFQGDTLTKNIAAFNKKSALVAKLQEQYRVWGEPLARMTSALPSSVSLDDLTLDADKKTFVMSGTAKDRAAIASLKAALDTITLFSAVKESELSISARENIPFTFTGSFELPPTAKVTL